MKPLIDLSPYQPIDRNGLFTSHHSLFTRKCAFTLAEGATHVDRPPAKVKVAFTLAEVLITLGVIGIVAAMTMPTLLKNIAERSNSEAQANLAQKITKSMDLMRADGGLERTYNSTDEFVDEFSKYIKISTRCDADHIADCWPTKTVTTTEGKTYDVSKAKTGRNLQLPNNKTDNVGIILADGATLIMTYNPDAGIIGDGDTAEPTTADLPIGFGRTKTFAYTTSVTAPIDFVMDVNGFKGPNSETRNGKYYDIRSFKVAAFSEGCPGKEIKGLGCVYRLTSYSPLDTTLSEYKKYDKTFASSSNYWAGAKKACEDVGLSLPTRTQLATTIYHGTDNYLPNSGCYWSSSEKSYSNNGIYNGGYAVSMSNGQLCNGSKDYNSSHRVLCVGD